MIKAVAVDVDGTLTEGLEFTLSLDAVAAIRKLERAGIRVILVSGNSKLIVLSLKRYIGTSMPVVFENGCGFGDFYWHKTVVDERMCEKSREIALKLKETSGWRESWQNPWRICDFALNPPEGLSVSEKDLEKFKIDDEDIQVKVSRHAVHISPKGCGKARGVEEVLKMYNISWDEVAAIGDAMNDKDMIMKARIGAAVGDAQEGLKRVAKIVAPYPSGKGFAWFAEYILSLIAAGGKGLA